MQAATPAPALRPLGVGDILDRVFNLYRGRPLLFLALAAIPYFVFVLVLGVVLLAIAGVLTAVTQQTAVGVLAFVAASCIGLVVTIYLAASWLVAPVVVTLEGIGPTTALDRSWKLADGHRWRILGIQLLLLVL